MQLDPMPYILAAALFSGCLGFFAASALAARRIRRAETEGWKCAVRFYSAREKQAANDR